MDVSKDDGLAWRITRRLVRLRFPDVPSIGVEALRAWLDGGTDLPLLLDARSPGEYAVSHLKGAISTPDVASAEAALRRAAPGTPAVAYCSVGYRSSALAKALRERGFRDVRNLEGSLFAWANRGLPVYRDGEPVDEVHPYGWPWSCLLR